MSSQKFDRFISPSIADRRWKELVESSNRPHPFRAQSEGSQHTKFASANSTSYNSNYSSISKDEYRQKARLGEDIPPAGRPSYIAETARVELDMIKRNCDYQQLVFEHMRSRQSRQLGGLTDYSPHQT